MLKRRPFTELYIHVPFCRGKCDYCAFYSEGKMDEKDLSLYLEKLFSQMEEYASSCGRLRTVYFGGGTPTRRRKWSSFSGRSGKISFWKKMRKFPWRAIRKR